MVDVDARVGSFQIQIASALYHDTATRLIHEAGRVCGGTFVAAGGPTSRQYARRRTKARNETCAMSWTRARVTALRFLQGEVLTCVSVFKKHCAISGGDPADYEDCSATSLLLS